MWRPIALVVVGVALLALPAFLPPYPLQLMVMVGVFGLLTLSLNLISGYAGMISLGHAGFFLVGAYTSALLAVDLGAPFGIGVIAAFAVTGVFGLFLGLPALKLSGHFLAVITIAFGLIVQILSVNAEWLTNGISGVSNIPRPSLLGYGLRTDRAYYYLVLGVLGAVVVVYDQLIRSGFGRALKALREDETAAACMGVDVKALKIQAFVISAGIAGVAGALYAHYVRYINPDSFTIDISIRVLIMMVVGGVGSVAGSLLGALTVYVMPEALRFMNEYYYLVFGAVVVGMMLFLPGGLASLPEVVRRGTAASGRAARWSRRVTHRGER